MKLTKYIGLAMAMTALASCSNDEDLFRSSWKNDPQAVHFNATVAQQNSGRSNPMGTPEQQATFNEGEQLNVWAVTQDGVTLPEVTYTLTGNQWTPETSKHLYWKEHTMTFHAYTPLAGASATGFTIPADQSDLTKMATADYMTYSGDQTKPADNANITLAMERQTARVIINVAKIGNKFSSNFALTEAKVKGYTVIENNASSTLGEFTPYVQTPEGGGPINTTFTVLMAPNAEPLTEEVFFTFKAGDTRMQVKGIPALIRGKSYTFQMAIGNDEVRIEKVSVEPWTQGTSFEGGEIAGTKGLTVNSETHTIKTTNAGYITEAHIKLALNKTKKLVVEGPLNGTDIKAIRQAAGCMYKFESTSKGTAIVEDLDLTKANIVAGGETFFSSMYTTYSTIDNVISDYMFYKSGLTAIKLPESSTTVGLEAFAFSTNLKEVILSRNTTTYENARSFDHTGIVKIVIPNTVTKITEPIFTNCDKLTTIEFEAGGTAPLELGSAFQEVSIQSIEIPERTTLLNKTFNECKQLSSVTFEEGNNDLKITGYTFKNCTALTTFTVPKRTVEITGDGNYPLFFGCTNLETITFENSTKDLIMGNLIGSDTKIQSFVIPKRTIKIQNGSFNYYTNPTLTSLTFEPGGSKMLEIGEDAFRALNITELIIPSRVSTIGINCFRDMKKLTKLTIESSPSTLTNLSSYTFRDINNSNVDLYLHADWFTQGQGNFKPKDLMWNEREYKSINKLP